MTEAKPLLRPAWYVLPGDNLAVRFWNILHWPYTALHLSFVVLGAAIVPGASLVTMGWLLVAFFLGMGVGAHALDLVNGDPLRLRFTSRTLFVTAVVSLGLAAAIGVWLAATTTGWGFLVAVAVGLFIAAAYNLEWFGGAAHTDHAFALFWGVFPFTATRFAYPDGWGIGSCLGIAGGMAFCYAVARLQRDLSTRVRFVRRRIATPTDDLGPIERALAWLCLAGPLIAGTVLLLRM